MVQTVSNMYILHIPLYIRIFNTVIHFNSAQFNSIHFSSIEFVGVEFSYFIFYLNLFNRLVVQNTARKPQFYSDNQIISKERLYLYLKIYFISKLVQN